MLTQWTPAYSCDVTMTTYFTACVCSSTSSVTAVIRITELDQQITATLPVMATQHRFVAVMGH